MSFSYNAKMELCNSSRGEKCCALAECYGVLLFCNTFSIREIRIVTGNHALGQRLIEQFARAFQLSFDAVPEAERTGKQAYIITDPQKLGIILEKYGYAPENLLAHHVNLGVLEDECCRRSFIRGAFLAGGAITDPAKRYHLEIVTDHYNVSRELFALLLDMGFVPKEMARSGNYVTYFRQSAAIEDLLTMIGAPIHAMAVMSAKIEKDMRNSVNRLVNCDTANVTKTIDASAAHIAAIERIIDAGMFESLPDKLKQTAVLRMHNPESSIKELADISTPPVTKSCLGHRLRRLEEISNVELSPRSSEVVKI